MTRREFIELLARVNQTFYGTPDGRGALRAFELTFEHRWIYVFELVQNALDAGARSIALRLSDDGNTFRGSDIRHVPRYLAPWRDNGRSRHDRYSAGRRP